MQTITLDNKEWTELRQIDERVRNGDIRISARNVISTLLNDYYDYDKRADRAFPIWSTRFGVASDPKRWRDMLKLEKLFVSVWCQPECVLVDGKHVAYGDDEPYVDVIKEVPKKSDVKPAKTPVKKAPVTPVQPAKPVQKKPIENTKKLPEIKPVADFEPMSVETIQPKKPKPKVNRDKAEMYAGEILDLHTNLALSSENVKSVAHDLLVNKPVNDTVLYQYYLTKLALSYDMTDDEIRTAYDFIKLNTHEDLDRSELL